MSIAAFLRENVRFLLAGGLLSLTSSYGQTYFIAIFAGVIRTDFALTDGQWGLLYTVATTASALVMFWAGALTDYFRVRQLALVILPTLAVLCLLMSLNASVVGLAFIVFALRLFGQGMTSQLAITSMARWFVARRGLALSITALGFALGQSVFPVTFAWLLDRMEWRWLWVVAAGLVLVTLPVIFRLLALERTPQSLAADSVALGMDARQWTRPEVLRSELFWLALPMLLGPPAWGTALFFQQVHIAEVKGWQLVDYLALLPLLTIVAVVCTLLAGQAIDRFGTARLAQVYLVPYVLAFLVIGHADTLAMAALGLMIFGVGAGMQATVPTAFWAEFYGTRYIGAIKAVSTSIMVFGSAVGPGVSGVLIDLGLTFPEQCVYIALYFLVALVLIGVGISRARPRLTGPAEIHIERA